MNAKLRAIGIVPAAGLGVRMAGGRSAQGAEPPKQLLELEGVPILFWTLRRLAASPRIEKLIVAVRPADTAGVESRLASEDYAARVQLVEGGESRQESVAHALQRVPAGTDLVLVHDAVRPLIDTTLIDRVLDAAAETGAAILGLPATDTIKQVEPAGGGQRSRIVATVPRERIVYAQTPQVFRFDWLRQAVESAAAEGFRASDEAMLVERLGHTVTVVMGSPRNIKITTPADLKLARFLSSLEKSGEPAD
jgi:2-C-methyl-D-erythritol 4-phosphate cytidylyltransferase